MAFEKMGAFTFNHAEQPDELNVAADIAKANFDSRANELKTVLNKVVDLLNATTDGASGADNVGATAVDGLTGKTVQTILEEIKTLVDTKETPTGAQTKANTAESSAKTYADGQVGDLAGEGRTTETVKGNADAHIAHLAETVSFITTVTRDISLTGDHIINLLQGRVPKKLNFMACVNNTKSASIGVWSAIGQRAVLRIDEASNKQLLNNAAIEIRTEAGKATTANVKSLNDGSVTLNWVNSGSPTGTATITITAEYHGGVE